MSICTCILSLCLDSFTCKHPFSQTYDYSFHWLLIFLFFSVNCSSQFFFWGSSWSPPLQLMLAQYAMMQILFKKLVYLSNRPVSINITLALMPHPTHYQWIFVNLNSMRTKLHSKSNKQQEGPAAWVVIHLSSQPHRHKCFMEPLYLADLLTKWTP